MKRIQQQHIIAWLLLIILAGVVVHAPLSVFVGVHWPVLALPIKAWKEALLALALVLIAIDYTRRRAWRIVRRDWLVWLSVLFILLHGVCAFVMGSHGASLLAGLLIDLRFVGYFLAVYLFLHLYPKYRQSFITIGALGALVVLGFAVLQLVLPHDFLKYFGYSDTTIRPYLTVDDNPAFIRENSTLRGPNPLGVYALMALTVWLSYGIKRHWKFSKTKHRTLFWIAGGASLVALWVSYSRSALLGALLAAAIVLGVRYGKKITRRMWVVLIAGLIVVAGSIFLLRHTYFVQNVIIHDNPSTGAHIVSNEGHLLSLQDGVSRMLHQPLGGGVGSTGSASLHSSTAFIIENQFLFVAHEAGWLGLATLVGLLAVVLWRLWQRRQDYLSLALFAAGIGCVFIGLMQPVWVDDTVSIIWWGMAAVMMVPASNIGKKQGNNHGKKTNKKAKRTA